MLNAFINSFTHCSHPSLTQVIFLAAEMGPLSGLFVGTEQGSWYLDEVDVYSSRTRHVDRYENGWALARGARGTVAKN